MAAVDQAIIPNALNMYNDILTIRSAIEKADKAGSNSEEINKLKAQLEGQEKSLIDRIVTAVRNTHIMQERDRNQDFVWVIEKQLKSALDCQTLDEKLEKFCLLSPLPSDPSALSERITLNNCGGDVAALMIDKFISMESVSYICIFGVGSVHFSSVLHGWIHRWQPDFHQITVIESFAKKGLSVEPRLCTNSKDGCSCLSLIGQLGQIYDKYSKERAEREVDYPLNRKRVTLISNR